MTWIDETGRRHDDCAVFCKTHDRFGGLSNMASGYPLLVNGISIPSSEALYQACRFSDQPAIQYEIIDQSNAFIAKLVARKGGRREHFTRSDWIEVRVPIMRWCLAVKLACHPARFQGVLLATGDRSIVEQSRHDDYWGAKHKDGMLVGRNVLGRLLMELRDRVRRAKNCQSLRVVFPLAIPNFRLLGQKIGTVDTRKVNLNASLPRDTSIRRPPIHIYY